MILRHRKRGNRHRRSKHGAEACLLEESLCLYVEMVPAIQQGLDEEGIEKNAFLAGRHDCF